MIISYIVYPTTLFKSPYRRCIQHSCFNENPNMVLKLGVIYCPTSSFSSILLLSSHTPQYVRHPVWIFPCHFNVLKYRLGLLCEMLSKSSFFLNYYRYQCIFLTQIAPFMSSSQTSFELTASKAQWPSDVYKVGQ